MKRVALYVRVSTAEQKKYGISVDSQIDALRKYCKENKLHEMGLYNDAGISARKKYTSRPALMRLLDDCRNGLVDMILFTKLDRWSRNVANYYEIQSKLDEYGVPWKTIWEDYSTDEADSSARLRLNILLSVAESEADRTSERLKAVNSFRRERGDYLGGNAPIGYEKINCRLKINKSQYEAIRAFFEAYIDYKPLDECVHIANEKGATFSRNTAYRILRSPFYYGEIPYITEEEHRIIERRLSENRPRKTKVATEPYLFSGLVHCGYCKHQMSASSRRRESIVRGQYTQKLYQCHNFTDKFTSAPCTEGTSINEEILEDILLTHLEAEISRYNIEIDEIKADSQIEQNEAKIKSLKARLSRLSEMYEMGDITKDEYILKRDSLKKDISSLEALIAVPDYIPPLPYDWVEVYKSLNLEDKRIFWHRSIRRIEVFRNREIKIVF